jgi:hypothetical protein
MKKELRDREVLTSGQSDIEHPKMRVRRPIQIHETKGFT